MSNLKHFDTETFDIDVLKATGPVIVDFWAEWCPPCRMMEPHLDRLATEFAGRVTFGKLDVDENQEIAMRYGVMGIPTLGIFRGGMLVDRMIGFPGSAGPIKAWIEKNAAVPTV